MKHVARAGLAVAGQAAGPGAGGPAGTRGGAPRAAVLYAGPSFMGLPLREVIDQRFFLYGDCEPTPGQEGGCPAPLQLQVSSICEWNPFAYTGPMNLAEDRYLARGALVARYEGAIGADVYTGRTTVRIFLAPGRPDRAHIRRLVSALRPVRGPARLDRPLAPPAFPRQMLEELDRVRVLRRRLGSVKGVHRRLGISRAAVRDRLALGRTLRRLGPRRATPCRRVGPPPPARFV